MNAYCEIANLQYIDISHKLLEQLVQLLLVQQLVLDLLNTIDTLLTVH